MLREVKLFDAIDEFAGRDPLVHALALSFGYDGDIAYERLWRPLIEKYGVRHPFVVADGALTGRHVEACGRFDAGTSLAVQIVRPARSGRGVFHPKLFLAIKEGGVLLVVGSANLTAGGLGGNLELVTALEFVEGKPPAAPKQVLRDALAFLHHDIRRALVPRVGASSLAVFDDILRHASIASEAVDEGPSDLDLRFVHSGQRAIFDAVLERHVEDPVEKLLVVSPFFEREDPDCSNAAGQDGLLERVINGDFPWSPHATASRMDLFAGAVDEGICRLPREALERFADAVALHKQLTSQEPRRLHGKAIALFGGRRVTLLWGSPNFTPSALLRQWTPVDAGDNVPFDRRGGNAECGLLLSVPREALSLEQFRKSYALDRNFGRHSGEIPEPPAGGFVDEPLLVDVGEVLYDAERGELSAFVEVLDSRVTRVAVSPVGLDALAAELVIDVEGRSTLRAVWPARWLEETDPGTGRQRLRTHACVVVAYAADGAELSRMPIRLNVRFGDALEVLDNLLVGPAAVTADALLVPTTAPPEQRVAALRAYLQRLRDARASGIRVAFAHQASLDVFYRNVRRGLDARWRSLDANRGSRFALLRWSSDLRRALEAATDNEVDGPRRAFLVQRTSEHIERVLDAIPAWHGSEMLPVALLGTAEMASALRSIAVDVGDLGPIADDVEAIRSRVAGRLEGLRA